MSSRHLLSIRIIILFYVLFPFYVAPNFFCILCNDASVHYSYATCSVDQTAKWAVGAFSHDFHICRHPSNFSCKYEHFNLINAVYRQLTSISSKPQDRIIYSSERVDSAVLRIGRTRLDSLLLFPISSVNIASRTHPPPPPRCIGQQPWKGANTFADAFRFSNSGWPLEPFCQSVSPNNWSSCCLFHRSRRIFELRIYLCKACMGWRHWNESLLAQSLDENLPISCLLLSLVSISKFPVIWSKRTTKRLMNVVRNVAQPSRL